MTPIEELKEGLDELGVEYDTCDLPNGEHGLSWIDGNDIEWEVVQQGENFRIHALQLVTPEQAIAATVGERNPDGLPIGLTISNDGNLLNWMGENYVRQDASTVGAGTCREIEIHYDILDGERDYGCSECKRIWYSDRGYKNRRYKYCPNCGKRIKEESE